MSKIFVKKLNESFIKLENIDFSDLLNLKNYFSFYTENYRWHPKYKAGIWSGMISLVNMKNQTIPIGILKDLYTYLIQNKCDFTIDSAFKFKKLSRELILEYADDIIKKYDCNLKLRDYQENAIVEAIQNRKAGILSATGCLDPQEEIKCKISKDDYELVLQIRNKRECFSKDIFE